MIIAIRKKNVIIIFINILLNLSIIFEIIKSVDLDKYIYILCRL